ncbi:aminotransferase class IV [Hyphomonas sp.]|uniref:aminotransferase class IV n=1 Tax=Hyphomonas sp. TaxID=87 RepID=UPI003919417E
MIQSSTAAPGAVQPFDLSDRGLMLADGVFTTARIVRGGIILREAHLARLARDAAALGIAFETEAVEKLLDGLVPEGASGALRVTVTRGPGARGLAGDGADTPTLMARFTASELPFPARAASLAISDIRRNPTSPSARHKTLSYTDNIMALRAATQAGFDEALLLNMDGNAACASAANVFARYGDRIMTPPVADGALPGVLRGWMLEHAAGMGLIAEEASLTREDLLRADGLFLTNSLRIVQPVSRLGETVLDPRLPPGLIAACIRLLAEARHD